MFDAGYQTKKNLVCKSSWLARIPYFKAGFLTHCLRTIRRGLTLLLVLNATYRAWRGRVWMNGLYPIFLMSRFRLSCISFLRYERKMRLLCFHSGAFKAVRPHKCLDGKLPENADMTAHDDVQTNLFLLVAPSGLSFIAQTLQIYPPTIP